MKHHMRISEGHKTRQSVNLNTSSVYHNSQTSGTSLIMDLTLENKDEKNIES